VESNKKTQENIRLNEELANIKLGYEKISKQPITDIEKPKGILKKVTFQIDSHQSRSESKEQFDSNDKSNTKPVTELEQVQRLYEIQIKECVSLSKQNKELRAELKKMEENIKKLKVEPQYLKATGKDIHLYTDKHNDLNKKYTQTLNDNYKLIQEQESLKHNYNIIKEDNKKLRSEIEQLRTDNNKLHVQFVLFL